jgi:hypothetical protein
MMKAIKREISKKLFERKIKGGAVCLVVAVLALSACATLEQKMTEAGATRLDGSQVESHLTGMTERWTKGGGFYNLDGQMEVVWKGTRQSGTWDVSDDGKVCYKMPAWEKECHHYLDNSGQITLIYKKDGKTHADVKEMFTGNQLSTL